MPQHNWEWFIHFRSASLRGSSCLPEVSNSCRGHVGVRDAERLVFVGAGFEEVRRFPLPARSRHGLSSAQNASEDRNLRVQVLFSALMIHNTFPRQARIPRSLQWIHLITIVILISLISHNLKYVISIGSNISVQNTEFGGFPNSEALPFVYVNLILLYCWKSLEHFTKLKAWLHLWKILSKLLPCFALCFPERHALHFNNRTLCLW